MKRNTCPRFYAESDGDVGNMAHYVVDRYGDPLSGQASTMCKSRREADQMAVDFNEDPPWKAWDYLQAEVDGYPIEYKG